MHQSATRKREKAVVNSPQPIYDPEPSMVDDDDVDTSKEKEIDKLMALISLSFKKIYKPTNNNLRTSSNTSRANQDNSPRIYKNAGYEGQRSGTVAGARDTIGSSMVQKSGIQCYNCKEYGHIPRECQKPKRAKDHHREKMLLCKQEEAGIQLNAEQADWRDDTDDESDDQELEAHYMYMAKLQQVSPDVSDSGPIFDKEPEQKVQIDDDYDVLATDCQTSVQSESVHNTYLIEQDALNVLIESEDMSWKTKPILDSDGNPTTSTERVCETYKTVTQEIKDQLNAKAEAVQIILTGIDNDIYSTVDACPNACEMWKAIKRLKQEAERAKDAAYHREKMLLCKQEEARIQLNAEQADWKDDTDDESDDQELEAHYMYMAKLQQVSPDAIDTEPIFDKEPEQKLIEIVLFIVESGCSKHMTGN
nr:ribonuclease H-like domain-containing protein [Tanacetum cinerariifolium]